MNRVLKIKVRNFLYYDLFAKFGKTTKSSLGFNRKKEKNSSRQKLIFKTTT